MRHIQESKPMGYVRAVQSAAVCVNKNVKILYLHLPAIVIYRILIWRGYVYCPLC